VSVTGPSPESSRASLGRLRKQLSEIQAIDDLALWRAFRHVRPTEEDGRGRESPK
jgi:hypothetical protein